MNKLDNLLDSIFKNDITILAARPACGKGAITSELLYKYTIKENKKTLLYSLDDGDDYYITHLISRISNIPTIDVRKYFHPCHGVSKGSNKIDRDKFIDAIEIIQKSDFIINSNLFLACDVMDYLEEYLELEKLDLLIINSLDYLLKESKYSLEEILIKLKDFSKKYNTHIILWNNVKRDVDNGKNKEIKLENILNYDISQKYINNYLILKREATKRDIIEISNYTGAKYQGTIKVNYIQDTDTILDSD